MADFAERWLSGLASGRQRRLEDDAMAKEAQINALVGQAYADPSKRNEILGRVAPLSADVALRADEQFASRDDRINKARANLSRLYLATPAQGRARVLQQFGQDFQRLGLDPAAPDFEQMATGYAQAFGPSGSELPSEIRTLQMLQANPELLAVNDRFRGQKSFKEVTNPDGTVSYLALDSRTGAGGFAPIGAGGPAPAYSPPPPQPSPGLQPDSVEQVILKIEEQDGPLPPEVRQKLAAQLRAGGPVNVSNPAGAVAPQSQPAVNRPPTLDQIPLSEYGGGNVGGSGIGESNADRARAAAAQAAQVEAAKIGAQQAAAPRGAELEADAARQKKEAELLAERNNTAGKRTVQANETLATLRDAISILPQATGGVLGQARDSIARAGNESTEGSRATAKLKLLSAELVANVPRFEGPQSNIDVKFYMEAAGDLANPELSVGERMAAAELMLEITQRYADKPQGGQSAQEDSPPVPGARKAPDGNWYVQQNGQTFKVER